MASRTPIFDQLVAEFGDPFRVAEQAAATVAEPAQPVPDPRGEQAAGQ